MSTIIYDQDYNTDIENLKATVVAELRECANQLEKDGECRLYLGGTVFAHLDFKDELGVSIEV